MAIMLIKRTIGLVILFCLFIVGCKETAHQGLSRWDGKEFALSHEDVYVDKKILTVKKIILLDSALLIKSGDNTAIFSLFRLNNDTLNYSDSFLSRGRGFNEVNEANAYLVREDNALVVAEYNPVGKYIIMPIDKQYMVPKISTWSIKQSNIPSRYVAPTPIDTVEYIALSYDESQNNLFVRFSLNDDTFAPIDIFYPNDSKHLSFEDKAYHIFSINYLQKRPNHRQFAYCFQNGHYVELFTLEPNSNHATNRVVVFDELPQFSTTGGDAKLDEHTKAGFRITVSANYVYMMDTKLTRKDNQSAMEVNGYLAGYIQDIYVCDWSGNPTIKFTTDIPIADCVVDKDNKYLYASTYDAHSLEERIVRFALPPF